MPFRIALPFLPSRSLGVSSVQLAAVPFKGVLLFVRPQSQAVTSLLAIMHFKAALRWSILGLHWALYKASVIMRSMGARLSSPPHFYLP
jgi:hypothetical protein